MPRYLVFVAVVNNTHAVTSFSAMALSVHTRQWLFCLQLHQALMSLNKVAAHLCIPFFKTCSLFILVLSCLYLYSQDCATISAVATQLLQYGWTRAPL